MQNDKIQEFQRFFREGLNNNVINRKYNASRYTKANINMAADGLKKHYIKTYNDKIADLESQIRKIKEEKRNTNIQITEGRDNLFRKLNMSNHTMTISKAVKDACWDNHFGPFYGTHLCYCCKKKTISKSCFHAGHVIAEANGGQATIENLRPICHACKLSMGTKNMNDFIKEYGFHQEMINQQSNQFNSVSNSSSIGDFSFDTTNNFDFNSYSFP